MSSDSNNLNQPLETSPLRHATVRGDSSLLRLDPQTPYMQQVGAFTRLTQAEEQHYAAQFTSAKEQVKTIIGGFPTVILHQLKHFNDIKHDIRISNFIELKDDGDDERVDADIRMVLASTVQRLEELCAPLSQTELQAEPDADFAERFKDILSALTLRDSFYSSCLKLLEKEEDRRHYISDKLWARQAATLKEVCRLKHEAHAILVERNLRLVISIAQGYARDTTSLQDLIQEGNIGLMRAVEKFDYRRGHRLSTYASYWIRQSITRSLTNHSRTIRISASVLTTLNQIRRCEQELYQRLGVLPTPEQIADNLGLSAPKVRALLKMAQQPISLQSALAEDSELADIIPDSTMPPPEEIVAQRILKSSITKALDCLNERERYIIIRRYGLNDEPEKTLGQISVELGLSSERVRQIEAVAMRKLRSREATQFLDGYQ